MPIPHAVSHHEITYFPSIQKSLPRDWCDLNISLSQKATKSDDAIVPKQLWNNRIIKIFPLASKLLEPLRKVLLRYIVRKLYRELVVFLAEHHDLAWKSYLDHRASRYLILFKKQLGGCKGCNFLHNNLQSN